MSNKSIGNGFEQEFAEILSNNGFWCHVFQQNKSGQPADIVAIRFGYHTLIDCKVVSHNSRGFPLSRVEENQWNAMRRFQKRTGEDCWFALKLEHGSIWIVPMREMERIKSEGRISRIEIMDDGKFEMPLCEGYSPEYWIRKKSEHYPAKKG